MAHDVKTIQNIEGLARLLGHNQQVRFPHVGADEAQQGRTFGAKLLEEAQQGFLGTIPADKEQSFATVVDLVDQRQKLGAFLLPADLVDADGGYAVQDAVGQPPGNGHFYRAENIVPFGLEDLGRLLPRQTPCPSGKKPGVGGSQVILPFGPGNPLHLDTALRAVDTPHDIQEEDSDAPQRNKLKAPDLQSVVAGAGIAANRTKRPTALARSDFDFKEQSRGLFNQPDGAEHKTMMKLNSIQYRLEQHPVFLSSAGFLGRNPYCRI